MTSTRAVLFLDTRSEPFSASRKQNFVGFGEAARSTSNQQMWFSSGHGGRGETDGAAVNHQQKESLHVDPTEIQAQIDDINGRMIQHQETSLQQKHEVLSTQEELEKFQ